MYGSLFIMFGCLLGCYVGILIMGVGVDIYRSFFEKKYK